MTTEPRLSVPAICALLLLAACGRDDAMDTAKQETPTLSDPKSTSLPRSRAPQGARVFFITPANGEIVPKTFTVEFGVEGMSVVRAGDNTPDSGHHHLLIDAGLPDLTLPVPADANHVHFGDGSSTTEQTLETGEHTLQLLFADHLHIPHDPPVFSDRITITVE